jgi:phage-related protein
MADAQRTVRIRFTGDAKGLIVSTKEAETAFDRLQDRLNKGFAGGVKGAVALASKVATVSSAIGGLSSAGTALATASGALLAAPAALVGYATILGAVKLGADGAARAGERFTNSIKPVKDAVSASFEKALNPAVDKASTILTGLKKPMQGIVTQLGGMATDAASTAALPKNMSVLTTVGFGTEKMLGNLRKTVAPLTQAFIDLVSVAAPGLSGLGENAGGVAQKFADWIRAMKDSGELAAKFQAGKDALAGLGAMLADVAGIVGGVFRGITSGGASLGGVLGPVLDQLNRFINSAQGQKILGDLGNAMNQVGLAVSSVVGPALTAVAPLLGPLASLFADVTTAVSALLIPVIDFLAPGLEAVAGWVSRNTEWLAPLAVVLGIVTGAVWLLNVALAANPIMLVITAIGLLVLAFVSLWNKSEGFRNFFKALWWDIQYAVGYVVDWVKGKWNSLIDVLGSAVSKVAQIGANIGEGIKSGFKAAVNFCVGILNRLISVANTGIDGLNFLPGVNIPHIPNVPGLARGGTVTAGGLVKVGERGSEIVSLPAGAQVHPHRDTEALLNGAGGGGDIYIQIGDEVVRVVRKEMATAAGQATRRAGARPGGAW